MTESVEYRDVICKQRNIQVLVDESNKYATTHDNMLILRGSFYQGEQFYIYSHSKQCNGIAAVCLCRFLFLHPNTWTVSDTDYIVQ